MKLKDLIESSNTGLDAIKRAPIVDYNTGVRCLRIGDISNNRSFNEWGYTEVEDNNYAKFKLQKGDIVVARTGATIGINKFIDKDYKSVYNNGLIRIRVKQGNNPKYVYYLLQSNNYKNFIKTISMGTSTQPNMQINDLLNLEIPSFDRYKQDKIVKILGNIDDKIKLNNEINNNLYELMKNKFDNFIDNLDRYEESVLSKIANYKNGLAMQKYRPINELGLPVIKIREMNSGISTETERCRSDIDDEVIINNGDVLFAWSGTLCMSIWCGGKAGLNQHIFKVTSDKYPKWFYYFWTLKHLNKFIEIAAGKATTMGHIKKTELDKSTVKIPSDKSLEEADKIFTPLLNKYISNNIENRNLIQLRETLLPKLMNGEIDLDNIEI